MLITVLKKNSGEVFSPKKLGWICLDNMIIVHIGLSIMDYPKWTVYKG